MKFRPSWEWCWVNTVGKGSIGVKMGCEVIYCGGVVAEVVEVVGEKIG